MENSDLIKAIKCSRLNFEHSEATSEVFVRFNEKLTPVGIMCGYFNVRSENPYPSYCAKTGIEIGAHRAPCIFSEWIAF